jgi:hypothetical protein
MKDYEVTDDGAGYEELPTEILMDIMFNVMNEIERRLTPQLAN